ncbi:MAG: MFS transporter [Bryobacterales bacterium]|nr:MFS transporter [Bryobacterales bacterium]
MNEPHRLRWLALFVFTLASALSFIDRQLLAALAPVIQSEFGLTLAQYGTVVSVFSFAYALTAPLAGMFIDRSGLNTGIVVSIALWSAVGVATGMTTGFLGLLACRAALGVAESGNLPASGKAVALYLAAGERALGSAVGQIGISIGMVVAPVLASGFHASYGWRLAFVAAGVLGFAWIPLWLATARAVPRAHEEVRGKGAALGVLVRDRRLWGLIVANILSMTIYSLWMNWTTVFLVKVRGLTQQEANLQFAWIPPLFAALGGLAGGSLSYRFARRGEPLTGARLRAMGMASVALLATALAPLAPSTALATAVICWSFFWTVAYSVNTYSMPIDLFGTGRAATGVAALTMAYGLMQTVLSPFVGAMVDRHGFVPVCAAVAVMPLLGWVVLWLTAREA